MRTTKLLPKLLGGALAVVALAVLSLVSVASGVRADGGPIFLTRLNSVIATYPANVALNVGSTTPSGGAAKLGVSLNVTDTFTKAFEIASTTGNGTATTSADIFKIKNTGCVQMTATSSATQVKLVFGTVATTSVSGFVEWSYGTCP